MCCTSIRIRVIPHKQRCYSPSHEPRYCFSEVLSIRAVAAPAASWEDARPFAGPEHHAFGHQIVRPLWRTRQAMAGRRRRKLASGKLAGPVQRSAPPFRNTAFAGAGPGARPCQRGNAFRRRRDRPGGYSRRQRVRRSCLRGRRGHVRARRRGLRCAAPTAHPARPSGWRCLAFEFS